ncbi:radical SAM protein [Halomicrobium sp. IBSBa]|uniref:SPL family radical SAM protein n=1 Tax=Halomicrobium sp. IBSBa TaxID=2778916 RepID=UPI001ABF1E3F|nr:radical SAM protein [Halomicrobium sp. IBSBa]MBO4248394.1 radical SAM protein [Halomicrobium sp. IBSBa]
MTDNHDSVRTGEDPTKAILSESGLNSKHLCDYVVNVATGCRHGCKFCYVPSTPNIRTRPDMLKEEADVDNGQKEWGNYVLYRDGLGERLDGHLDRKRKWRETERGQGVVGISFSTDCYMDGRAGKITRNVVDALTSHQKYARVLTRNPILALQDLDVFQEGGEYVTIGSSIPCMDTDQVAAIEPSAPAPEHRLRGLKEFNEYGVQTYVSMSPTYPTQDKDDLREQLERVSECDPAVVFHEPINPRGGNFEMTVEAARDAGEDELADELDALRSRERWVEYATNHLRWVQEIGQELDLPVHLWPDKQLIKHVSDEEAVWLQSWRDRQSPEEFADRETPHAPLPAYPQEKAKQ